MKQFYRLLSFILCIALLLTLAACKSDPEIESSDAPESTQPTETEAPPSPDHAAMYAEAVAQLLQQDALQLRYTVEETRHSGREDFTQNVSEEVYLKGLQGALLAEKSGTVSFNGDREIDYEEYFTGDKVYVHFDHTAAVQEISAEEYLAARYPISLLDPDCYDSISAEDTAEGTLYTFTEANALEQWLETEYTSLISAEATALVTDAGISKISYNTEYDRGTAVVTLRVDVEIEVGTDFTFTSAPTDDSDYILTENALLPWVYEWAVSNLLESYDLTVNISKLIQSDATGVIQLSTAINTYGEDDVTAQLDHQVAFYSADTSTTYAATERYEDGVYTYTVDDVVQAEESMKAHQFRNGIIYTLNQYILTNYWITSASLSELDGIWLIDFASEDAECIDYVKFSTSEELYGSSSTLDDLASAYTTSELSGSLAVDMDTMLPTAYTLNYAGVFTIEEFEVVLSQEYIMSVTPASTTAYYTLTEEHAEEAEPEEAATPLFYHVTGADGSEMWLLGTIHVGDERTAYLPQEIYDAFDASDALAVEFNIDDVDDEDYTEEMINSFFFADSEPISTHIDSELYDAAYDVMRSMGQFSTQVDYMKAFAWESMITNAYLDRSRVLDSNKGVDQRLIDRAKAADKEILNVESLESQFLMLAGFSDALQELQLSETVEGGYYEYVGGVYHLYELWCKGDEAELTEYLADDTSDMTEEELKLYEEYNNVMLVERNAKMTEVAVEYLNSGKTVFYAVGLGHLLGETGLVESLRAAGYTVELVSYHAA